MAGKKKAVIEFDEFDEDIDELDLDAIEIESGRPGVGSHSRWLAWQRLEERADTVWLNAQLEDWDQYLDIH